MYKNYIHVLSLLLLMIFGMQLQAQVLQPIHPADTTKNWNPVHPPDSIWHNNPVIPTDSVKHSDPADSTKQCSPIDTSKTWNPVPPPDTIKHNNPADTTRHGGSPIVPAKVQGTISGVVTSEAGSTPIAGIRVDLISEGIHNGFSTGVGKFIVTDSTGTYSALVDTGIYIVRFSGKGFVSEFYDNATNLQTATKVVVAQGATVVVSASLAAFVPPVSFTLQGSVKAAGGNIIKSKISVFKLRSNTFHLSVVEAKTDSLGNYSARVNSGDTVIVFAEPQDHKYAAQYYNGEKAFADADRIAIRGDVSGIDFVLELKPVLSNGISGSVVDTLGVGIKAHIAALKLGETGRKLPKRSVALTDSLGNYSLTNLAPGKYILEAIPQNNFGATFYKADGTTTLNWKDADSIVVDSTSVISGINFVVRPLADSGLATIAGTVHDQLNASATGTYVYALNASNKIASFAVVGKNGQYVMNNLLPGNYKIAAASINYTGSTSVTVAVDYSANATKTAAISVSSTSTTDVSNENAVVTGFNLYQNYPNPFNPSTVIKFSLPEKMNVKLTVYDMMGREVAQLINGVQEVGTHSVEFNASGFASGVYFYTLSANKFSQTHKLVLLK